jgi:hypothetical protein
MTLYKLPACDWSARAVISPALYSIFTAAISSGEAEGLVLQLDSIGHPGVEKAPKGVDGHGGSQKNLDDPEAIYLGRWDGPSAV